MKFSKNSALFAMAFAVIASSVISAVPQSIPYQGRLMNNVGDPVTDGAHLVKFIIYDAAAAGTDLWNSGFQNITTANGLFAYNLGSSVALPDNLFSDTTRYLGITVGVDTEISPRVRLETSPYAYQALRADSAEHAAKADLLGTLGPGDVALSSHNHDGSYAGVSHNHAATNITSGTLSTSRFDAYSDFSASGRLDNNSSTDVLTRSQLDSRYSLDSHAHSADITGITTSSTSGLTGGVTSGTANLSVDPTDFNGSNPAIDSWTSSSGSSDGTDITLRAVAITAPVAGRIVANAKTEVTCVGCISEASAYATLSTNSTAGASTGSWAFNDIQLNDYETLVCMEVFPVNAGTHTIYFRAKRSGAGGGSSVSFWRSQLMLSFIPN